VATPWPFNTTPDELRLWKQSASEPGTGYLITDAMTLQAIRQEREHATSRGPDTGLWFGPYEERYYGFSAREVVPLENDVGLIPDPPFIQALWE
jgi:hypothetical protein